MPSKRDEAKQDLIERAGELALHRRGSMSDPGLGISDQDYLELYYRRVAPEDLVGRDPADIADPAFAHRELARERPQGVARVAVLTPERSADGWAAHHTLVQVVTDDMPFLVDSVTNAIGQVVPGIYLVVHPQVAVRRSFTGELREILPAGHDAAEHEATGEQLLRESWIQVEIDRVTPRAGSRPGDDPASGAGRRARGRRGLAQDAQTALRIADDLATDPPPGVSDEEVSEAWELLRWLADDHFTFLGYREYELPPRSTAKTPLRRRARQRAGHPAGRPAGVRRRSARCRRSSAAKAREAHILVLTKANTRSTVHRPAYLDYVGVKLFDADGEVVGERRFLGLFTRPPTRRASAHPGAAAQGARGAGRERASAADSHDGKDLMEILETYPRDELFQISVDELLPIALAVLHLQERRQTRLFLRRDVYGRFMSCLVYLPRDRYTTAGPAARWSASCSRRSTASASTTPPGCPSRCWPGCTSWCGSPTAGELPRRRPADARGAAGAATRSWDDDFVDALRRPVRRGEGRRLARDGTRRVPRGLQGGHPPADGGRRPAPARGAARRGPRSA